MVTSTAPSLVPVNIVAQRLGLSPRKVWSLIAGGELRTARIGRRRLVPEAELVRFIDRALAAGRRRGA